MRFRIKMPRCRIECRLNPRRSNEVNLREATQESVPDTLFQKLSPYIKCASQIAVLDTAFSSFPPQELVMPAQHAGDRVLLGFSRHQPADAGEVLQSGVCSVLARLA